MRIHLITLLYAQVVMSHSGQGHHQQFRTQETLNYYINHVIIKWIKYINYQQQPETHHINKNKTTRNNQKTTRSQTITINIDVNRTLTFKVKYNPWSMVVSGYLIIDVTWKKETKTQPLPSKNTTNTTKHHALWDDNYNHNTIIILF